MGSPVMCTTRLRLCERLEGAWLYFVLIDHIEVPPIGHMLFIIIEYYMLSFAIIFTAVRAIYLKLVK